MVVVTMAQDDDIAHQASCVYWLCIVLLHRCSFEEVSEPCELSIGLSRLAPTTSVEKQNGMRGGDGLRVDEGTLVVDVVDFDDEEGRGS